MTFNPGEWVERNRLENNRIQHRQKQIFYKEFREKLNALNEKQQKLWDDNDNGSKKRYYILRSWKKQLLWMATDSDTFTISELHRKYNVKIPEVLR
jgi:hypothetical protein